MTVNEDVYVCNCVHIIHGGKRWRLPKCRLTGDSEANTVIPHGIPAYQVEPNTYTT